MAQHASALQTSAKATSADGLRGRPAVSLVTVQADVNDVLEKAKAGDREAFRELFRRHRSDVARLA